MRALLRSLWRDESGQALVEYGMVVGLVVVGAVGILLAFRTQISTMFTNISGQFSQVPGTGAASSSTTTATK